MEVEFIALALASEEVSCLRHLSYEMQCGETVTLILNEL